MRELLPCPFCGHATPEFERLGTPRQSCIVVCGNCGCRHESSDEGDRCGDSWNSRAAPAGQADALRKLLDAWHEGRLIAGQPSSLGYVGALIANGEAALAAMSAQPDAGQAPVGAGE